MVDSAFGLQEENKRLEKNWAKDRQLFACSLEWLRLLETGHGIIRYFKKRDYNSVAIYGVGDLADILVRELEQSDIVKIEYLIDRMAINERNKYGYNVYLPEEISRLDKVDVVIITAFTFVDEIRKNLIGIIPDIPSVGLDSIIDQCLIETSYSEEW